MKVLRSFLLVLALAVTLASVPRGVAYADEATPAPRTLADPEIAPKELRLLVKPLRRDQLAVEAEAWVTLLEERAHAVVQQDLLVARSEGDAKTQALEALPELQAARDATSERLEVVLAAWREKGGDPTELETYVQKVGGIEVDLTDTQQTWTLAKNWITSPDGGIKIAKNIALFLLILLLARVVSNLVGRVVNRGLRSFQKTPELLRNFLVNSTRNVLFLIGLVVALSYLGVDIGPLIAAIGAAGLVVGFALQSTLSNFASGVMILLYQPYDLGDVVTVAGVTGKVEAMSLVSTTIKTPDNQILVVPNSSIWGSVITNSTGSDTRRVDMVFGIGYGDDVDQAQKVLEDILAEHPLVLKDPAPTVTLAELADSAVNFNVRPWVKTGDYWTVLGDVTREVKKRFDATGISIPFPQREVHVHQVAAS